MSAVQASDLDVLTAARQLGVVLNAGGREARETGHLTEEVIEAIIDSRLLMMFVPETVGGLDVSFIEGLRIIEELSHADGPAGWSMMAVSVMGGNVSSGLSSDGLERLVDDAGSGGPRVAGQPFRPGSGRAALLPGAFILSGSAQFASGSMLATHFIFTARVFDDGEPVVNDAGVQEVIAAVVPREDVKLRGNWDVDALEPTESVDYALNDVFIDAAFTYPVGVLDSAARGRMYRAGSRVVGSAVHGAVAVGLARRLLEEIAVASPAKSRGRGTTLADDALFEHELASCAFELDAVSTLFYERIASAEDAAVEGDYDPDIAGSYMAGLVAVIHEVAMRCADLAYRWAGSSAFRSNSAIGRFYRDMSVARNHLQADRGSIARSAPMIRTALERDWRTRLT